MLITYFKYGYPAPVELKVNDIPNHFMQRQRLHLIIRKFGHQLHPLTEFRYPKFQTIQTNGLNTYFQLTGQFLVSYERILFNHSHELLLSRPFGQTFDKDRPLRDL
ncbi:hypothetical protein D3C81_1768260 [compost metagenome]